MTACGELYGPPGKLAVVDATVVVMDALLLADESSMVSELTLTLLVNVPAAVGATTVTVISGALPTARLARVQDTGLVPVQVHPLPVALVRLIPAGRVSVTLTLVAVLGPALLTERI